MNILGISAYYHDSAACLVRTGEIVAAAQEERFSRVKHDHRFPLRAARYCLVQAGLEVSQIDLVAFYDKPLLKFERLLETYLAVAPAGLPSFMKSMPLWLRQKLWLPEVLKKELGYAGRVIMTRHHQAHAASAFFPSPYQEAAVLTMDGVGEWATTSWGMGKGNNINLIAELRFPHSLGLLYSAFTYFTGFKVNSGEYKLMGLAPYGQPRHAKTILSTLMDLKEDGSFKLDQRYFNYCQGLTMTNQRFADLFGGRPRQPESPLTQREMDLAASVQLVTEEVVLRTARHVHAQTGQRRLVMAGGVALNCVANGRLLREGPFEDIWIQPAAGDAGGALGAALYAWHQYQGQPRQVSGQGDSQEGSYLGPAFDEEEIAAVLARAGATARRMEREELLQETAALLAQGKVVGWFQGRMEFGPRALGNRSILGDPRDPGMQSRMNLKIKYRESFRPFAPAVLTERVAEYFQLDRPSPYMLLVADVQPGLRRAEEGEDLARQGLDRLQTVRSTIPAVTHVDYSARVQTVCADINPLFHALLQAFEKVTGCGVLINTSFNVRGEPVVCQPEHAYSCFMRTEMDYLAMGPFVLDKRDQPAWQENEDWRLRFELD